ncbi:group 1 truncated hemoglobin [Ramlibacter sp. AN1015]|uniref:group I truncated hemoglobin n=1 Tax=Ramlibacter sp. AN1015 TaxID=3133428 RepID=UPI0030C2A834
MTSTSTPASLYERLGRNAGITRIVTDVVEAHLANPLVAARYRAVKDIDRVRNMAIEFFCAGTGGPEPYTGRDMLSTHKGMNISEQEYMAVMDDILGALEKHQVDAATRGEVAGILYSLKGDILRV